MKKKIINIIFLIISFNITYANNDSLINIINTTKNDTVKLNTYINLSNKLFYSNSDSTKLLILKGISLARKLNLINKEFSLKLNLGILYNEIGKIDSAKKVFDEIYKTAETKKDTSIMIKVLGNLGNAFMINGEYEKALEKYNKVLYFYQKRNNKKGTAMISGAIGNLYIKMTNYKKAINFYEKSKNIFIEINAPKLFIATSDLNLGIAYRHEKEFTKAEKLLLNAYDIFDKAQNKLYKAKCLIVLASLYSETDNYRKSKKYYLNVLNIYKSLNSKNDIITILYNLASLENKNNDYKASIEHLLQAYDVAKEINNFYYMQQTSSLLAETYGKIGDFKSAYKFSIINKQYSDSVLNTETAKKIAELESKYNLSEKQRNIEILTKNQIILEEEKKIDNIIIVVVILLLIIGIFIFILISKHQKLKAKEKEMLISQKLFNLQMDHHFIYNSIFAIQQFIEAENLNETKKYLSKFSRLIRLTLQSTKENFISISEEIEIIENYLALQQLLNNNKFDFEINIDKNIDTSNLLILPMIVQPFIENSIKHAFKNIDYKGLIVINFIDNNDKTIHIEILDNGSGISLQNNYEKHKSMAIDISKSRLKILYKGNLKKSNFVIKKIDKNNSTGTVVSFDIPKIEIF